jgi:hypothetical protein
MVFITTLFVFFIIYTGCFFTLDEKCATPSGSGANLSSTAINM